MRRTGFAASRMLVVLLLFVAGLALSAPSARGQDPPPDDTVPEEPPESTTTGEPESTTTTTTEPPEPEPEPEPEPTTTTTTEAPDGDSEPPSTDRPAPADDDGAALDGDGDSTARVQVRAGTRGYLVDGMRVVPTFVRGATAGSADDDEPEPDRSFRVASATASRPDGGGRVPFIADFDDDPVPDRPDRVVGPASIDSLFEQAGAATALGVAISAAVVGVGMWVVRRRLTRP